MKLRADRSLGRTSVRLGLLLAGCGLIATVAAAGQTGTGPAADYPMVLGAPYTIDGVTYTPVDRMNLDQVGYAEIDPAAGPGITIAHRTLPLPSYAEVTSLRTGRTILVRVERRGPPSGNATVALSPAAAAQLGTSEARTPIRIRRVNPPEPERAALRAGQTAPLRMDTPMSLVGVLMRKLEPAAVPAALPATGAVPPAAATPGIVQAAPGSAPVAPKPAAVTPKQPAVMPPHLKPATLVPAAAKPTPMPSVVSNPAPKLEPRPVAPVKPADPASALVKGATVVQVGAYASRENAERVAARIGGTVSPAGKVFRVRIGGLASPQAAAAALAKARAAGYSEARIQHAD